MKQLSCLNVVCATHLTRFTLHLSSRLKTCVQWPWMPTEWKATLKASPWQRMFDNAFTWCVGNEEVAQ